MLHRNLLTITASLTLVAASRAQVRIVDDLPGSFVDIASTGTELALTGDGEVNFTSTIGNSLLPAGLVRIAANGGARFGTSIIPTLGADLAPANTSLPAAGAFLARQALLPYWDDLVLGNPVGGDGTVLVEELGNTLIIQWEDVRVSNATVFDRMSFQIQVLSQGPVLARYVYRAVGAHGIASGGGASATIGYQGPNGTSVQYALDARAVVANGTVLSLVDSALTTTIVDSLPGTFIDIAATGTALGLLDDDELNLTTGIRNALLQSDTVRIGANGGVKLLGGGGGLRAQNAALPSNLAFDGATSLLPFWDDLLPRFFGTGEVYAQEFADRLVIQWDDVGFFQAASTERVTFQVQIFHGGALAAQFLYEDVQGVRAGSGASATIGYQADGLGVDVQHSFNAASISNGTVLSLLASGDEVGTEYCLVVPNSTGDRARIRGTGSRSLAANDLRLEATLLPPNAASFFLVGTTTGFVPNAGGSQGNLCLGGQLGRVVGGSILSSGTSRSVATAVDLLALPSPAGTFAATVGQTLSFQCWFRDSAAGVPTSNLSSGLQVQLRP